MTVREALATLQIIESGHAADSENLHQLRLMAQEMADAVEKEQGHAARLSLWRRLFKAHVFREPPLSGVAYDAWRELYAESVLNAQLPLSYAVDDATQLSFSVLMPVYNPNPAYLAAAIESVLAQSWAHWELCIADDCSTDTAVHDVLRKYAAQDARVKVLFRSNNGHISEASNTALAMADARWCALMDHDDLLEPHALTVMAAAIVRHPDASVFFSDEDQFDGCHVLNPMFKHGFDPDLLLSCNCVSHLGVYRADVMRDLGGFRKGLEGAQDHDLALRCLAYFSSNVAAFCHVPGVLYHWRRHEGSSSVDWTVKPYVREAALKARQDYAAAVGIDAEFSFLEGSAHTRVRFGASRPLLSLCLLAVEGLIPAAVRDVVARTSWSKREILLVVRQKDKEQAERVAADVHARVLIMTETVDADANTVEWNAANRAAKEARGRVLAFVRVGDIPLASDWCERAMGVLNCPGVAVVGCRAVDKNGFLIHAGYAMEHLGQNAWHPAYGGLHTQSGGYFHWAHLLHSVLAVPLSGMFCRSALFEELGGFATDFCAHVSSLAGIDYCLRAAHARGQRCVILPDADMLSFRPVPSLPYSPVFAPSKRTDRRFETLSASSCQNPYLNWTDGGWTLLEP